MSEETARALAHRITESRYWFVEETFETVDPGKWCVLLRHRYDTPTQLYVWESQSFDAIEEDGAITMQEYAQERANDSIH